MKKINKNTFRNIGTILAASVLLFFLLLGLILGLRPDKGDPIAEKYRGNLSLVLYEKTQELRSLVENGTADSDELVIVISQTEYDGNFDVSAVKDEDNLRPLIIRDEKVPSGKFIVKQYAVRAYQGNREVSKLFYVPHKTSCESGALSLKRSDLNHIENNIWGIAVPDSLIALYSDYEGYHPSYFTPIVAEPLVVIYYA